MQIAQVVVKTRTTKEEVFDYEISPELLTYISIGILIEVPFHGRKMEGIIVGLKRKSNVRLKKIIRIIDPVPVVDEIHIKLARWMSNYYFASLGKALFENIVPPAKRTIGKTQQAKASLLNRSNRGGRSKKYLIIGNFSSRIKFYSQAIEQAQNRKQAAIILVPDLSLIPHFTKYVKSPIAILHAGMTKTQRWLEWDRIRRGEVKVVIGSQSALFAPAQNLGLIMIDQEENETYKNDRSPRYNAVDLAGKLADLSRATLVLGSLTPRVETYLYGLKGKYRILKKEEALSIATIVDMNTEKFVISNLLEAEIENKLRQKQKILLVLNRKGEGTKFSCSDCGWIALCEKCGLPLVPQKLENVCFRCEKSYSLSTVCPKCQSVHLRPMGLGTARLKKFLYDLFPKAKIIQIEKELDEQSIPYNWDIAIATNFALKFPFPQLGLVAIIDADQSLNFPDFNSAQKSFSNFYKFLRLGKTKIIQTHLPENKFICNLAKMDYESFFLDETVNRKKFDFPPFTRLIRLEFKHTDEEKCKNGSQEVFNELAKFKINISPPYIPLIARLRHRYRYQMIIKTKRDIPNELKNVLKALPSGWIVDVDPINLL